MKKQISAKLKFFLGLVGLVALIFLSQKLFFHFTDGFLLRNIHMELPYRPDWKTVDLDQKEQTEVLDALNQPYTYLGKGCQSYAFESADKQYVIKFFKFQHFRPSLWYALFPPFPPFSEWKEEKKKEKLERLNLVAAGWKMAFDHLKKETGLLYVHLNQTIFLPTSFTIRNKLGTSSTINLNTMQFCLQRRGTRLDDWLLSLFSRNEKEQAKRLIDELLSLFMSEYKKGFADNDHAIMQNTGVVDGRPFHIDIGQFVYNEEVKEESFFHQELFTKTYRLMEWLKEYDEETASYLAERLKSLIGPSYSLMKPNFRPQEERIKNQPYEIESQRE